jgi:thiol-disulfide isomerase/thioredoxin
LIALSFGQASFGVVAFVTLANSLILLALVRQVGILLLRIGQVAPTNPGGLQSGSSLDLSGFGFNVVPEVGRQTMLVFVTTECGACRGIVPAANEIAHRYKELEVVLAVDSAQTAVSRWTDAAGVRTRIASTPGILKKLGIPGTPYACMLDDSFRVLKAGGVNHLDHLEALIHSCAPDLDANESNQSEKPSDAREATVSGPLLVGHVRDGEAS